MEEYYQFNISTSICVKCVHDKIWDDRIQLAIDILKHPKKEPSTSFLNAINWIFALARRTGRFQQQIAIQCQEYSALVRAAANRVEQNVSPLDVFLSSDQITYPAANHVKSILDTCDVCKQISFRLSVIAWQTDFNSYIVPELDRTHILHTTCRRCIETLLYLAFHMKVATFILHGCEPSTYYTQQDALTDLRRTYQELSRRPIEFSL